MARYLAEISWKRFLISECFFPEDDVGVNLLILPNFYSKFGNHGENKSNFYLMR
jgi:hypothetical protein